MNIRLHTGVGVILWLFVTSVHAETAYNNYILRCMGCHGTQGDLQQPGLPSLRDFVGHYLKIPGGREYLVQVPGAAQSPLSDDELAAVLNLIIHKYAGSSKPKQFQPYTGAEVASYRGTPLLNAKATRQDLLIRLNAKGIRTTTEQH